MSKIVPVLAATALLFFPLHANAQPVSSTSWQVDSLYRDDGRLDFLNAYRGARETSRGPDAGIEMGFLISCEGTSSGIFLSAGTPLAHGQSRVAFRFDDEAAETASWAVDPRDGVSVMLRDAGAVRSFVERVLVADEMVVQFEDADWMEAAFDLRMDEEQRREISSACSSDEAAQEGTQ
ncbi:hypothetical protein [Aquamicrobium terrae]|uniref:Uncharacterized protein n=1 Tax=Aquamicrobium terrae TaxID=1324945 RepID=A0ABV2MW56_9HYPH